MAPTETTEAAGVPADFPETKASHPTKGRRYRVLDGDDGDVCIVRIVGAGNKQFPPGTLLPIEGVPRFETATEAKRWIRSDSGETLKGMQVMVFQAKEILNIEVETKPTVKITEKPKRQIAGLEVE